MQWGGASNQTKQPPLNTLMYTCLLCIYIHMYIYPIYLGLHLQGVGGVTTQTPFEYAHVYL